MLELLSISTHLMDHLVGCLLITKVSSNFFYKVYKLLFFLKDIFESLNIFKTFLKKIKNIKHFKIKV